MLKTLSFRKKLFIYFFTVFLLFTLIIITFQYSREKKFRVSQLDNSLHSITEITHNYITQNNISDFNFSILDSLIKILPQPDVRITIINQHGTVLYDNFVADFNLMENHFYRPEIQESLYKRFGTSIRKSATTGQEYYYYSRKFDNYFIRAAVIYNIRVKNLLKAEPFFLLFISIVFAIIWLMLDIITRKFAESITKLKDFVILVRRDKEISTNQKFPKDELGVIGDEIIHIYDKLIKTKNSLSLEREKLFNHLYVLNEGVAFFSMNKTKILSNNVFIQYLNVISNKLSVDADEIFDIPEFDPITKFIEDSNQQERVEIFETLPSKEITINKSGKYFKIQCIIFNDNSFEIIISNITRIEKNKILKQQMTSNISHELKTPITSIKGFLETIINDPEMDPNIQKRFIQRADAQATRLTDLINDIVILNKIEETGDFFAFKNLHINEIINEITDDLQHLISEKQMHISSTITDKITVKGNKSLILSIFRNLFENSIKYAGVNCEIKLKIYREDDNFYYFSLSDNGVGIPDEHLHRIFERFYRIGSDRSRKLGGTGLGLAIVKNAVILHKGEISVKNKSEGGIEFLFSLPKIKPS